MSDLIQQTTDATFDVDVLQSDIPVLLDFWAPWCGPCKAIAPVLERLAVQHEGKVKIVKYNVDQSADSYARFKIRGVPTLVAMRGGEEVARGTGVSASGLRRLLDSLLQVDDSGVATSAVASTTVSAPVFAGTFGGDADRKARCIQQFETALTDGRFDSEVADLAAFANGDYLPSVILAEEGKSHAEVLGLPISLSSLLDYFQENLEVPDDAPAATLQWLNAMPVGVDLRALPLGLVLHLLTHPEYGVMGKMPEGSAVGGVFTMLVSLHQREGGQTSSVAQHEWSALRERADVLSREADKPTKGLLHEASRLMRPYREFDGSAFSELIPSIAMFDALRIHGSWWNAGETATREKMQKALAAVRAELGEKPIDERAAVEYDQRYKTLAEEITEEMHREFPLMPERNRALRETTRGIMSGGKKAAWDYVLNRFLEAKGSGA